jgi:hypothetical protein
VGVDSLPLWLLQVSGTEFYSARILQPRLLVFFFFGVYYILRDSYFQLVVSILGFAIFFVFWVGFGFGFCFFLFWVGMFGL